MEEDKTKEQSKEELAELICSLIEDDVEYDETQEYIPDEFVVKYNEYMFKIKVLDAEEEPKVEYKASLEGSDTEEGERE